MNCACEIDTIDIACHISVPLWYAHTHHRIYIMHTCKLILQTIYATQVHVHVHVFRTQHLQVHVYTCTYTCIYMYMYMNSTCTRKIVHMYIPVSTHVYWSQSIVILNNKGSIILT